MYAVISYDLNISVSLKFDSFLIYDLVNALFMFEEYYRLFYWSLNHSHYKPPHLTAGPEMPFQRLLDLLKDFVVRIRYQLDVNSLVSFKHIDLIILEFESLIPISQNQCL